MSLRRALALVLLPLADALDEHVVRHRRQWSCDLSIMVWREATA